MHFLFAPLHVTSSTNNLSSQTMVFPFDPASLAIDAPSTSTAPSPDPRRRRQRQTMPKVSTCKRKVGRPATCVDGATLSPHESSKRAVQAKRKELQDMETKVSGLETQLFAALSASDRFTLLDFYKLTNIKDVPTLFLEQVRADLANGRLPKHAFDYLTADSRSGREAVYRTIPNRSSRSRILNNWQVQRKRYLDKIRAVVCRQKLDVLEPIFDCSWMINARLATLLNELRSRDVAANALLAIPDFIDASSSADDHN